MIPFTNVVLLNYIWPSILLPRCKMALILMFQLTGKIKPFPSFTKKILSGMDMLRNDVAAIVNEIMISEVNKTKQNTVMPPDKDSLIFIIYIYIYWSYNIIIIWMASNKWIRLIEIIALRTAGKRQPGKNIAIYIGTVLAILVILYNLIRDISFAKVCDKDSEWICSDL